MNRVTRYDKSGVLGPPVKTEEGFIVYDAVISRPGVFTYQNPDGTTRRELRPRDEVFASASSFNNKPTTLLHPTNDEGERINVTPETAREFMTGHAFDVSADPEKDTVRARLTIMDRRHLAAIAGGMVEQSCGYDCDVDETPGVDPEFGEYDAIQRNITGNHIATVPRGRAGANVRLRADAATMLTGDEMPKEQRGDQEMPSSETPERMDMMNPEMMGKMMSEVMSEMMEGYTSRMDAMVGKMDAMMTRMNEMMPGGGGEMPDKTDRADGADGDAHAERMSWYQQRQRLERLAGASKIEGAESMDNAALAREIAKQRVPNVRADASDDYILGVIEGLEDSTSSNAHPNGNQAFGRAMSRRADSAPTTRDDLDAAKARYTQRVHNRNTEA